ncbi:MAG: MBL fold metallo-hydrolase [Nitrospiraceae bacterium]|nr:MAG: MBL fold metallo-hydrolase [Nitrospiraceae bacterium]
MKLIILGSGTCVPSLKRNSPGYYLEAEDYRLLVDCGSGTLLQLERAGKSYKNIDAVFITHKHPDHFSDLMPLIQALLATPQFKREKELLITAPEGFAEYYEKAIASILGTPQDFLIKLAVIDETDTMEFGPLHIAAGKTVHSHDSISYRFEYGGKSVVFTGDADYDQKIIDLAANADLLIADCSFPDSQKAKGHLSSKECGLIARKAGVKKLVLSHIYPSSIPDTERVHEAMEVFNGKIVLAEDLMVIEI